MQISYNGINFLKEVEGFRDEAYLDTGGVWTIGYGTTRINGHPVTQGMKCTKEQATQWLYDDIASTQTTINTNIPVTLTQNQFDALVSFVYNIGVAAFGGSTMLKCLRKCMFIQAGQQFDRWNKDNGKVVAGLTNRRALERKMFEGPSS